MPETDGLVIRTFACVWDALTDSPAEAATMRVRSDLLSAISDTVAGWDVTRAVAAQHLDLTRPRLDELLRGSVGRFSIDELIGLATRAGLDVRVQARPARAHTGTRRRPRRAWRTVAAPWNGCCWGRRSVRCAASVARLGSMPAGVRMRVASGGPDYARQALTISNGWRGGLAPRRCTGRSAHSRGPGGACRRTNW